MVHTVYYKEGEIILLPTKCRYSTRGAYCDRSDTVLVKVVTVLKVVVNPVRKYIDIPEYQSCITNINKVWELDHIGILTQEIKPKDHDVRTTFEDSISYDKEKKHCLVQLEG